MDSQDYQVNADVKDSQPLGRTQPLSAGQYWRALLEIPDDAIPIDQVLLIKSLRFYENKLHTVLLAPHPGARGAEEHRFLIADFLAKFAFEPDGAAVRASELALIQAKVSNLQDELISAQKDPNVLAEVVRLKLAEDASVPALAGAPELVTDILSPDLTPMRLEALKAGIGREGRIVAIKGQWILAQTKKISAAVNEMVPYFEEQAAAALAATEEVQEGIKELLEGIKSLDLYVGKDVVVRRLSSGESAPTDQKLTVCQRKLCLDEELAAFFDVDEWFDFTRVNDGLAKVAQTPALIRQIFPAQRCVLVMASTRRYIEYNDDRRYNDMRDGENKMVFLLVRDGENLFQVFSPVESHLKSARLFPTKDDQDAIFQGLDARKLKLQDLHLTDTMKTHESFALHYKRFLILIAGLDHRENLFGEFYPGPKNLGILDQSFQSRYLRFLPDDDAGANLSDLRPDVFVWMKEKHKALSVGSRIITFWNALASAENSPGAWSRHVNFDKEQVLYFDGAPSVQTVQRSAGQMFVTLQGRRRYSRRDEPKPVRLTLPRRVLTDGGHVLVLDAVEPEELTYYIGSRQNRTNFLSYIQLFKVALKFLVAERAREAPSREKLLAALAAGEIGVESQRSAMVSRAISSWRTANAGSPLPDLTAAENQKLFLSLCDQMFALAVTNVTASSVESLCHDQGRTPVRLSVDEKGRFLLYAECEPSDRDDRMEEHPWVMRHRIVASKSGLRLEGAAHVLLADVSTSETVLHRFPAEKLWVDRRSAFASYHHKRRLMENVAEGPVRLQRFLDPQNRLEFLGQWSRRRKEISTRNMVTNPAARFPIGLLVYDGKLTVILVSTVAPMAVLTSEEDRPVIEARFAHFYANKESGRNAFRREVEMTRPWSIALEPAEGFDFSYDFADTWGSDRSQGLSDLNLERVLQHNPKRMWWIAPTALNGEGSLALPAGSMASESQVFAIETARRNGADSVHEWAITEYRKVDWTDGRGRRDAGSFGRHGDIFGSFEEFLREKLGTDESFVEIEPKDDAARSSGIRTILMKKAGPTVENQPGQSTPKEKGVGRNEP